ncbi:MAG: sigma-70 family RNA polymerase sigma factor [Eggerthellaceae bacterium]|nr:sigma-70 family RNA polymerase sigma factor [Eggerthellaceae bacterium]
MTSYRKRESPDAEFERLYLESYAAVYNYVRYRMDNDVEVEDVVSEAFMRAARAFGTFDSTRAKFSTWVITIARNCMMDHWRRAHPAIELDNISGDRLAVPDTTGGVADRDLVGRLLAVLDDTERNLVLMKYREGFRNVDIAAELGMNASTVSTKLANALAKMRTVAQ